jgi:hypothetical protein
LTCAAAAQQPASSTAATATKADILRMFGVMHTREQIQQVMDQAMHQMQAMNREQLKKRRPELTDEDLDRMEKDSAEIMKDIPVDDMMQDMVPVYQKHLNRADVRALVSFYSTSTGQKLLRELPALTAEAMQAVYPRIQQHLEETLQRIDRQMDGEKKEAPKPQPDRN